MKLCGIPAGLSGLFHALRCWTIATAVRPHRFSIASSPTESASYEFDSFANVRRSALTRRMSAVRSRQHPPLNCLFTRNFGSLGFAGRSACATECTDRASRTPVSSGHAGPRSPSLLYCERRSRRGVLCRVGRAGDGDAVRLSTAFTVTGRLKDQSAEKECAERNSY